jgi:hypothetical protein
MPRIDVAIVYSDDRKEVVSVGRPADLIAFADKFDKAAPSEPYAIFELAWLAHRALKIEQPLAEWVDSLEDLVGAEEAVAAIKAELESPTGAAGTAAKTTTVTELELDEAANEARATVRGIESRA